MHDIQRKPFEPVGEVARWRILYQLLCETRTGQVLTYDDMAGALDLDPVKDRPLIQDALRRAAEEHLQVGKRAVKAVPNEGYRVVEPEEHLDLSDHHQIKAIRSTVRSIAPLDNVNRNTLSPDVRDKVDLKSRALRVQLHIARRFNVRRRRLDKAMEAVDKPAKRTAADVAREGEMLRWIGQSERDVTVGEETSGD